MIQNQRTGSEVNVRYYWYKSIRLPAPQMTYKGLTYLTVMEWNGMVVVPICALFAGTACIRVSVCPQVWVIGRYIWDVFLYVSNSVYRVCVSVCAQVCIRQRDLLVYLNSSADDRTLVINGTFKYRWCTLCRIHDLSTVHQRGYCAFERDSRYTSVDTVHLRGIHGTSAWIHCIWVGFTVHQRGYSAFERDSRYISVDTVHLRGIHGTSAWTQCIWEGFVDTMHLWGIHGTQAWIQSTWHADLVRTFEGRFRRFQDVLHRLVKSESPIAQPQHQTSHKVSRSAQMLPNVLRCVSFLSQISHLCTVKYPMESEANEMCLISIMPSKIVQWKNKEEMVWIVSVLRHARTLRHYNTSRVSTWRCCIPMHSQNRLGRNRACGFRRAGARVSISSLNPRPTWHIHAAPRSLHMVSRPCLPLKSHNEKGPDARHTRYSHLRTGWVGIITTLSCHHQLVYKLARARGILHISKIVHPTWMLMQKFEYIHTLVCLVLLTTCAITSLCFETRNFEATATDRRECHSGLRLVVNYNRAVWKR